MKTISIADDDLCATCAHCQYNPGGMSGCALGFPFSETGPGDEVTACDQFKQLQPGESNWKLEPISTN